jgi:tRNA-splicing ligase RtcB
VSVTIFGEPDPGAVAQIENVMRDERAQEGALMADHHLGYSMPIGGVVAYQDAISPSGVGYDIACGNMAARTVLTRSDLVDDLKPLMRQIQKKVAFGMGRRNDEPYDHALFDDELWKTEELSPILDKARAQLGTVGSGNHYVDLLVDSEDRVWVANHFGSRGFGHTVATLFMKRAYGLADDARFTETDEPAVLDIGTYNGDLYVSAMELAGKYAYAGREYVMDQVVREVLGTEIDFSVHNHHNYAWHEDDRWVVRKGATPLELEPAFIGGSMGDVSVIVRGKPDVGFEDGHVYGVDDIGALGSAPHGAGRVMSRTKAAGKIRKMWYCPNRNCDFEPFRAMDNLVATSGLENGKCPRCGIPVRKGRMRDTADAAIDWDAVRADLGSRGIAVLGAGADEAPGVYKDLTSVIAAHSNIEVLHTLHPIGVVMAGSDVFDPYKD